MEIFPIGTLMEEVRPTFTEKYVFDSREKSVDVATLGLSRLPSVWCKDQNQGFQIKNPSENAIFSNQEQKGSFHRYSCRVKWFWLGWCIDYQSTFGKF